MPLRRQLPAVLVLACLLGCGSSSPDEWAVSYSELMNGELSGAAEDGVVQLLSQHERGLMRCTGTLVAANLVLTAKHCVTNHDPSSFDCDSEGNLVSLTGGTMGAEIAAENVTIQIGPTPAAGAQDAFGSEIFSLSTSTICRNDIALVLLDRDLQRVPPVPIRLLRGATRNEPLVAIGYGLYSPDGRGAVDIRHRKADLRVEKIGRSPFNPQGDSIPPHSFQVNGGSLCMGDSGGPAIAETGAVIGIYSKSNGACTSTDTVNWFTETGPYAKDLIQPAFTAAKAEPLLEVDTAVAGSAGAAGALIGGASFGGASASEPQERIYDRPLPSGGSCRCGMQKPRSVMDMWLLVAAGAGFAVRHRTAAKPRAGTLSFISRLASSRNA